MSSLKITRDSTRILQEQNVHVDKHEAMSMCVEGFRVHGLLKHFQLLILSLVLGWIFAIDTNVNVFIKDYVHCLFHSIC
jgi:hypothetical protein